MTSVDLLVARPLSQISYSNSQAPYPAPDPGGRSENCVLMAAQPATLVGLGYQVSWTLGDVLTAPSPASLFMLAIVYQLS